MREDKKCMALQWHNQFWQSLGEGGGKRCWEVVLAVGVGVAEFRDSLPACVPAATCRPASRLACKQPTIHPYSSHLAPVPLILCLYRRDYYGPYPAVNRRLIFSPYPAVNRRLIFSPYPAVNKRLILSPYPAVNRHLIFSPYPAVNRRLILCLYRRVYYRPYPAVNRRLILIPYPAVNKCLILSRTMEYKVRTQRLTNV